MPRLTHITFKIFSMLAVVALITGCASSKKYSIRSYIQDKERIDQDIAGNVGNWENAPKAVEPVDRKETRKIYVLEINKEPEEGPYDDKLFKLESSNEPAKDATYVVDNSPQQAQAQAKMPPKITLPPPRKLEPAVASGQYVEYRVEKDDTLQKISKKFYNSYSKWPKIYDANKEVIKNPDFLQPGITIIIPQD